MKKLDKKAILKTNRKIDPTQLIKKPAVSTMGEPLRGNPTSPYEGRKAVRESGMNWTEIGDYRVV